MYSLIAQLVEQTAVNRWVVGSSPTQGVFTADLTNPPDIYIRGVVKYIKAMCYLYFSLFFTTWHIFFFKRILFNVHTCQGGTRCLRAPIFPSGKSPSPVDFPLFFYY